MFTHYQQRGKCEWYEGLADFVTEYNRKQGAEYVRSDCLDVTRAAKTDKQPEVLVTDERTGKQMVIERKSVVWPPSYILRHENEHEFAETLWRVTNGMFHDGSYELRVSTLELETLDQRTVRAVASEIGNILIHLDREQIPTRRSLPVCWTFGASDEYEDRLGITVIQESPMRVEEFLDRAETSARTASAMAQQLAASAPKFASYSSSRKVVLFDFYGKTAAEEEIPPLMPSIAVPDCVDEIWMTTRDWISEEDFTIGFERIFCRP